MEGKEMQKTSNIVTRTPLRRQPWGGRLNRKGHCHPRASSAKTRGFHPATLLLGDFCVWPLGFLLIF